MSNKENDIIQMISVYTDQIERYENMSTWFSAFCAVCILIVLISAAVLVIRQKRDEDRRKEIYDVFLSGIFLIIPSVITLYLYTFAMNMRKVALYRGYLSFLEAQYNELTGLNVMLFDSDLITNFFSFKSFLVNGLGPAVMVIFIVLSFVLGFGLSIYFLKRLRSSKIKDFLRAMICVLIVVCTLFDGLCCYYLSTNDYVVNSVINYCEEQRGVSD